MSYQFEIDGQTFTGSVVPGSSYMHITHVDSKQFIGAFQPDTPSLFGPRPSGAWRSIGQNTCLSLLEKIQPMVAELCKQRIINRYR